VKAAGQQPDGQTTLQHTAECCYCHRLIIVIVGWTSQHADTEEKTYKPANARLHLCDAQHERVQQQQQQQHSMAAATATAL
jgi:hypothetical protein